LAAERGLPAGWLVYAKGSGHYRAVSPGGERFQSLAGARKAIGDAGSDSGQQSYSGQQSSGRPRCPAQRLGQNDEWGEGAASSWTSKGGGAGGEGNELECEHGCRLAAARRRLIFAAGSAPAPLQVRVRVGLARRGGGARGGVCARPGGGGGCGAQLAERDGDTLRL